MVMPGKPDYSLNMHEVEQIGKAVGPTIREGMRLDLKAQTEEIREIVSTHESNDNTQFDKIDKRLESGDARMGKIETKLAWGAGAIAVLVPLALIIWDILKRKLGL